MADELIHGDRFLRPELEREEQILSSGCVSSYFSLQCCSFLELLAGFPSTSILPRICNFPLFHSRNMPLCVF